MADLYHRLEEYSKSDMYPFHMPGHKRQKNGSNQLPYDMDITEIEGFDNLTAPEKGEVLYQMQEDARNLYGAEQILQSHLLVNGSTSGLMAAISACTAPGEGIIMGRNCHKSVYRCAELLDLQVHYVYPQEIVEYGIYGNLNESELEMALQAAGEQCHCVVVTSPTYEGVILDIHHISKLVHAHNMALIVDEAHGAHLHFTYGHEKTANDAFSKQESAIYQGADLVIQSLHKTLPSMTQTAVIHVTKEALNRKWLRTERIADWVHMFSSTSPSYILMASMDECMNQCRQMLEDNKFDAYLTKLREEREKYKSLAHLHLLTGEEIGAFAYDEGKFVFITAGCSISGPELSDRLREEYHIECEMAARDYVIAMTSVCDTEEGLSRLKEAIFAIDQEIETVTPIVLSYPAYQRVEKKAAVKKKLKLALVTDTVKAQEQCDVTIQTDVEGKNDIASKVAKEEKTIGETNTLSKVDRLNGENTDTKENMVSKADKTGFTSSLPRANSVMTIREARQRDSVRVALNKVEFQLENDYVKESSLPFYKVYQPLISAGYVMCYPPGVPLLTPGEEITKEIVEQIRSNQKYHVNVLGIENDTIEILL